MKKWSLQLLTLIVVVSMTLSLSCVVFAAEVASTSDTGVLNVPGRPQKGSITVNYVDAEGKGIDNMSVVVYCVAAVKSGSSSVIEHEVSPEFAKCNVDGLSADKVAEAYATYALEQNLQGTKLATDASGKAVFGNLPLGMYLVVQQSEKYLSVPALVSVPTVDGNDLSYDLDIYPKTMMTPVVNETAQPSEPVPDNPVPGDPESPAPGPNQPSEPRLPQTGMLKWPVPVLSIGGMALFLTGWLMVMFSKNKKEKRENG